MSRNTVIDAAKGIGIVCVVLGHIVLYGSGVSRIIFAFHMPLFFFCSGLVFNYTGTSKELLYKAKQLIVPYCFFTLVGLFVAVSFFQSSQLTLRRFLVDVFYSVNPEVCFVGQLWFLIALLNCIVFFHISHRILKKGGGYAFASRFLFACICFVFCVLIKNYELKIPFGDKRYSFPFKLDDALGGYLFFFLGYYSKNIIEKVDVLNYRTKIVLWAFGSAVLLICAYFNGMVNIDVTFNNPILYLLGSIAGIVVVFVLCSLMRGNSKYYWFAICWYGKNSLPVFALHSLFLYGYAASLSKILARRLIIMKNISLFYSLIGTVICLIGVIPFVYIYNGSVAILMKKFIKK